MDELLAVSEVWTDSKNGERPTSDALESVFGSNDIQQCVEIILKQGSIQLTTAQRKKMVEEKKLQIINEIATTATDPKTRMPHPRTRIENALEEARFSVDPFKSVESQVSDAVKVLKPLIPLQFITIRLAFKIPGSSYGSVNQILRDLVIRQEWLTDGTWACVVEVPGGMKNELISKVASKASEAEVKELD